MIDSFAFGRIVIAGHEYRNDVIILPDGSVISPWWREESHRLLASDLTAILTNKPEILIAGTGSSGMMIPDNELPNYLAERGMELVALPTDEAVTLYNDLAPTRSVAACLHLTC